MTLALRWMTASDADIIASASHLFDDEVRSEWNERFLAQSNHHLCFAWVDGRAVGFVTGVEVTHPDKGTEMLLYELGVDEPYRRQGIGRTLTEALRTLAHDRGCSGMWVPFDDDNVAARATYRSLSPDEEAVSAIAWWDLGGDV